MLGRTLFNRRDASWLEELGRKLCDAHEPIAFDWERRFGLSHEVPIAPTNGTDRTAEPDRARSVAAPSAKSGVPGKDPPDLSPIATDHGEITFIAISANEVAIRHSKTEPLIEAVRSAAKGRGRWNPRYRNWIAKAGDLVISVRRSVLRSPRAASKT